MRTLLVGLLLATAAGRAAAQRYSTVEPEKRFSLGIQGGVAFPIGSFDDRSKTGWNAGL